MEKATLNPTADQTFELLGEGSYDFVRLLARTRELQRAGRVEEACNERFRAVQRLTALLPEDEEVVLEWNHRNARAALEALYASAVDHFLIDDFELSAALLEQLLELDPEDHLEASRLLAFDYSALGEEESFDAIIDDVSDRDPARTVLLLWAAFRRTGRLPEAELGRFRSALGPWYAEFTAAQHPADAAYLRDVESERPTAAAQARELWLQTENLWARWPEFIEALKSHD